MYSSTTLVSHLPQLHHHAVAEGVWGPDCPVQAGQHLEDWQVQPRLQDGMLSYGEGPRQHSFAAELHLLECVP